MTVGLARTLATEWVIENASKEDGFQGAYYSGSTVGMPDNAKLSISSDIDIVVVTEGDMAKVKPGKFLYKDVLLEVTYISRQQLASIKSI